jgi:tRNA pseudouridine38-40 synthase
VDSGAVAAAAKAIVGRQDFASFAGGGEGVPWSERARQPSGTTRTVFRCECREIAVNPGPNADIAVKVLEIRVAADGFLPRMVRNIVGALVEIGQGRQAPNWIAEILAARDRRLGSVAAPAHGLTLWKVGFAGESLEDW